MKTGGTDYVESFWKEKIIFENCVMYMGTCIQQNIF